MAGMLEGVEGSEARVLRHWARSAGISVEKLISKGVEEVELAVL